MLGVRHAKQLDEVTSTTSITSTPHTEAQYTGETNLSWISLGMSRGRVVALSAWRARHTHVLEDPSPLC